MKPAIAPSARWRDESGTGIVTDSRAIALRMSPSFSRIIAPAMFARSRMPVEQLAHFRIGRLRKVAIPQADRGERLGRTRTDGLVGHVGEFRARRRRADRHCDDDASRTMLSDGLDRCSHGRPGRQPIIDKNHRLASEIHQGTSPPVLALAPFELALYIARDRFYRAIGNTVLPHDVIIVHE